ncbi:MAG: hypothetical protein ACOY3P_22835 [Planctomycetota bacterium]
MISELRHDVAVGPSLGVQTNVPWLLESISVAGRAESVPTRRGLPARIAAPLAASPTKSGGSVRPAADGPFDAIQPLLDVRPEPLLGVLEGAGSAETPDRCAHRSNSPGRAALVGGSRIRIRLASRALGGGSSTAGSNPRGPAEAWNPAPVDELYPGAGAAEAGLADRW